MRQPTSSKVTAIALGLSLWAISPAHAEGFYIGLGAGQSKADLMSEGELESQVVNALLDAGYTNVTASASIDDTDTGWKIFGGWRFHKNFALELTYADLGEAEVNIDGAEGFGGVFGADASSEASSWGLTALGILPLTDKFSVFAKAGMHYWDVDAKVSATASDSGIVTTLSESYGDTGTDLTYGLGATFNITNNLAVRGEWERFEIGGDIDTDVDLASISVQFKF
jgi:OOP family OmpA-OmpF porin